MNQRWNYQSRTALATYLAARERLFRAGHYYRESDYYTTEKPEEEAEEYAGPSAAELLAALAPAPARVPAQPKLPPPPAPRPPRPTQDRRLEPRVGYFNLEQDPEFTDPELGPNWKRVVKKLDRRLRQQIALKSDNAMYSHVTDQAVRYCRNLVDQVFPERTRISEMEILTGELELDQRKRLRRKKLPA